MNVNENIETMTTATVFPGSFTSKMEVFNSINGCDQMRSSQWDISGAWSEMMEVADSKGHFVSDIIEKAMAHRFVSEKQAWCVAFFALKNGFVQA